MRILLDTQVWLWMLVEADRLGSAQQILVDRRNELLLSAASTWEISMKHALGRLQLPQDPALYVPERLRMTGVKPLPITYTDTLALASLPMHHNDPIDRLLIAQARSLDLTIMSADPQFRAYDVRLIPVT
jgi:PIN domain nuclease of toxin-antitoxin system